MRGKCFIVFLSILISCVPNSTAQFPENNEWEFGWETDVEPSYLLILDSDNWEHELSNIHI